MRAIGYNQAGPITAPDAFGLKEGEGKGESLLIIGAAGGVGSILIQLAKKLTGLAVIATASRPDTTKWVEKTDKNIYSGPIAPPPRRCTYLVVA